MGILSKTMKKNAVILQKPSETIAIRVELDAVQRKFYNALLFVAKKELALDVSKKRFTIPFNELKELLNKNEDDKNNGYYIEKLKEIKYKNAEYNILEKKGRAFGWVSLVSDLEVKQDEETKVVNVTFELPERIKEAIIDPNGIYANINLVVIRGLRSKYAIILYELVKDYQKVEIPEMTMKNFKKIFGIEGKYENRIDHLKSYVLDPAVRELNNNENIDFLVSYKLKKTGAKYTHIKFEVKPKPIKLEEVKFKEIQAQPLKQLPKINNPVLEEIIPYLPREFKSTKKVIDILIDALENKRKSKDYIISQIKYCNEQYNKDKVKNYVLYLRNAIEKDYACAEEVELDIVRPEDAEGYIDEVHLKDGRIVRTKLTNIRKDGDEYTFKLVDIDGQYEDVYARMSPEWLLERARKHKESKTR